MRKYLNVVAIALATVLLTFATTRGEDTPAAKPLHGKVTAIGKDATDATLTDITITSHGKKGETPTETVIKVDDKVKITKGTESATLSDVTVGTYLAVTMDADKKVTAIEIHPPHQKKPATTASK